MLVLSRKQGEQIQIGDGISITINRLSGNRVSLAIEAPKDVKIVRGELEDCPPRTANVVHPAPAIPSPRTPSLSRAARGFSVERNDSRFGNPSRRESVKPIPR